MTKVAVCIATCKRPEGLDRLLGNLSRLNFRRIPEPDIRVIVVDNDSVGTAANIVAGWRARLPWPIVYEIEPRRGIASARNRLVALAEGVDYVAFIDDDEVPHFDWLDELLFAQASYGSDIVQGLVVPRFEGKPPEWVVDGGFFDADIHVDGEALMSAATNNMLISTAVLSWVDGPFDTRMDLSGGEDSLLTLRLFRLGARIVFAKRAIVEEFVPTSRMTVKWLCQRAYRGGNTFSLCQRYTRDSCRWMAGRSSKGIIKIGLGLVMLFPSMFFGCAKVVISQAHLSGGG